MDTCERCGAELFVGNGGLIYCEQCGWEYEPPSFCLICGEQIDSEEDWWEDGICRSCAQLVEQP